MVPRHVPTSLVFELCPEMINYSLTNNAEAYMFSLVVTRKVAVT